MSLICMGRDVTFVLRSGHEFHAKRKRDGMLHDPSGKEWPVCSLLIAPFEQGKEKSNEGRDYFGRNITVRKGVIDLPPKSLDGWRNLGEMKEIFYLRVGKYSGVFRHVFNQPRGFWKLIMPFDRKAHGPALLYAKQGRYRVEMPAGCRIGDRGIISP